MYKNSIKLNFIFPELKIVDLFTKIENQIKNNFPFSITNFNSINQSENNIESELNDNNGSYTISIEDSNILTFNQNDKPTNFNTKEEKNNSLNQNKLDLLKKDLYFQSKHLGRKRKGENKISKHNKYSNDNIHRKCKHFILNCALEFINERLKEIYNGNIGNGIYVKKLLPIGSLQKLDLSANFSKNFLNKTLREIFSADISKKYNNFLSNHNSMIIKKLLNEKDENKKVCLQKLFSITFLQCVQKFIGINNIKELDGFKTFDEYKKQLNDEPEYIEKLKNFLINFEEKIQCKKERKKGKIKIE